jgi:hypothetical protein
MFKGLTARRLYKSFGVKGLIPKAVIVDKVSQRVQDEYLSNGQRI